MSTTNASEFSSVTYDHLILGGGVGGLTLAARLSEDPNVTVGVLEAGQHVTGMPEIDIPGYVGRALGNPAVDWAFFSEPQQNLDGRKIFLPRGKALGGTSVLNFMVLTRGNSEEYDSFQDLGNKGWNWDTLLPYLKKSETFTAPPQAVADRYRIKPDASRHGTTGPVQKTYPVWYPDIHDEFIDTMEWLGIRNNPDPNSGDNTGVYTATNAIDPKTVTRSSAVTSYYEPNKSRSNLHVLTGAYVTKVILDSTATPVAATGAQFQHDGKDFVVNAKREVILSAGAFQTPQLLELSGIGNPKILERFGIKTVIDLPSDHSYVPIIQKVTNETLTYEVLADPAVVEEQASLYAKEKKGMFSSVYAGYAMLPADKFMNRTVRENLSKTLADRESQATSVSKQLNLQRKWFDDPKHAQVEIVHCPCWMPIGNPGEISPEPNTHYNTLVVALMHPHSRGSVHINSAVPTTPPAIDPNYFADPIDLELMVEGVKFVRKAQVTGKLGKNHIEYVQPAPEVDDDAIRKWIKTYSATLWHPLGTASMLPKADGGVVGDDLIVYGTSNLRIVDASALPLQFATHMQTTVYALAEKAADIIKGA
ncbi:alcohol oxidase [Collybia nuda]|uniref:Alcohol oxidase n=1 Tax=Collybia nuda TaxID=64659 RepID=A0A9P5YEC9_9AGAR|nr:alcohol oxidase [Collybia nuda]